uniref:Uncharacterized protein n=1 Tax=Setaria italica TaxID=4555 RepID=K3ZBM0_SETIT
MRNHLPELCKNVMNSAYSCLMPCSISTLTGLNSNVQASEEHCYYSFTLVLFCNNSFLFHLYS